MKKTVQQKSVRFITDLNNNISNEVIFSISKLAKTHKMNADFVSVLQKLKFLEIVGHNDYKWIGFNKRLPVDQISFIADKCISECRNISKKRLEKKHTRYVEETKVKKEISKTVANKATIEPDYIFYTLHVLLSLKSITLENKINFENENIKITNIDTVTFSQIDDVLIVELISDCNETEIKLPISKLYSVKFARQVEGNIIFNIKNL